MKRLRVAAGCLLLLAGLASATTVWDAGGGVPANWNVVTNWTAGVPMAGGDGPTKAVFNRSGRAECEVSDARELGQLVQGDNGPGGVIRIRGGGSLSTGNNWTGVGYNRDARMIVETGGALNCGSHLWIGFGAPGVGRLEIAGGTVNVAGQFGLGWNGGTGHLSIADEGRLNLAQLDTLQSISGASSVDIGTGSIVIQGDRTSTVQGYIAAGKITGFGGSGTPVVDYNISHVGKTTVTAIPGQLTPHWHVAETGFPTDDWVVTPFDAAADFGIVADGATDMTQEIQTALVTISNLGGGALFLPAGHYKVTGNLVIPSAVTLRGDWRKPGPGEPVAGTVLMAYAGRDNQSAAPFITLNNSAGLKGVSIWYPEQSADDIRPYPPSIGNGGGATVENVTFVNSYWAYTTFVNGTTARPFLRNLCGTPLKLGIEFDCLADIGRIETVHFAPDYWADSGLPGAPVSGEHAAWIYQNGTGVIVRRIDWSYSCYVTIEGYAIGLALRPGRHDGKTPNGQSYGFRLLGCKTGVEIEASAYAGYQFTRFEILDAETGVRLSPAALKSTMFHSCTIEAAGDALLCEGDTARVLMMSCDIRRGTLRMARGYLSICHSDFAAAQAVHIELGGGVRGATILGNRFPNGPRILSRTLYPVHVNHTPLPVDPLPEYDFRKPATPIRPAKSGLFVVTEAPFNATANGAADATPAFQAALAAAAASGGGTVFVPGGSYRLNGNLTVPAGVELRGIFDTPNDTKVKGSLLNIHTGRNQADGTPFIQLASGSGIRGFTFHYPEQIYSSADTINFGMVPYPFLLRGLGSDIHVINLSATIPYQLLDMATHRCDRHYVDYIFATALKTGIQAGAASEDGQIHNCQFNPSSYTHAGAYYDSIPFNTAGDIHKIQWRDATPYRFGHVTGQVLHQNFVFGGWLGFHLVAENGHGPSGHCLGMGVDQCTVAMRIDAVGAGDLQPINSQLVTVDMDKGRYLETGTSLGNQVFRMFGSAGWGGHQYSAVISGGDVRLQLFHLARDGEAGAFQVLNQAKLASIGGNLDDFLATGRPFLTVAPAASAMFAGNVIHTTAGQMPANSEKVAAIGNLRFGESSAGSETTWTNGTGNREWNVAGNWDGGIPGAGSTASSGNDPGPVIGAGIIGSARKLVVDGNLNVTDGSLSIGEWMVLGHDAGNNGALEIGSGAVTIAGELVVGLHGTGAVVVNGGSLTVGGMLALAANPGSSGTITLAGGTLDAGMLSISDGGGLHLTSGTLLLAGDVTAQISAYAAAGRIIALGGAGAVTSSFNTSHPGMTMVTASIAPPATSYWIAPATSSWSVADHWTGGAAPLDPGQHLKVIFNVVGAGPCVLDTTATVAQLVMGDNTAAHNNQLSLTAGAGLTAGLDGFGRTAWTAVGYNRSAVLSVETGASLHCRNHLWIGYLPPAIGSLHVNGGTVQVAGQFGLGWEGGTGLVTIRRGGILDLDRMDAARSIGNGSSIDIRQGSVVIRDNRLAAIQAFIAAGKIVSYGGKGTVVASYDAGTNRTTVTSAGAPTGFDAWVDEWHDTIGGPGDDDDGDGLINLYEYALNGDPTDASDLGGAAPRCEWINGMLHFRHLVRKGDADLVYTLQSSPNLNPASWVEAGLGEAQIVTFNDDYNQVIHPVNADGHAMFFRLKIGYR